MARHSLALGVFASLWVANPLKGRLWLSEAACIRRKAQPRVTRPSGYSRPRSAALTATLRLKNMKAATSYRAKILAEIENIPFAVHGKICENRKPLANGGVGIYHNLKQVNCTKAT